MHDRAGLHKRVNAERQLMESLHGGDWSTSDAEGGGGGDVTLWGGGRQAWGMQSYVSIGEEEGSGGEEGGRLRAGGEGEVGEGGGEGGGQEVEEALQVGGWVGGWVGVGGG
jgi:hypothetical protein